MAPVMLLFIAMSETSAGLTPVPNGAWLVTIAASAGGIEALRTVLAALPPNLPAAIVVLLHRPAAYGEGYLTPILATVAPLPVVTADENQDVQPGVIYVARPDRHLTISEAKRFTYVDGTKIRYLLSSANPLFASAAHAFGARVVGVVLTGSGQDATDGVQAVKSRGGRVIAQDPATARYGSMPQSAVDTGAVDYVLPLGAIGAAITAIVRGEPVAHPAPA